MANKKEIVEKINQSFTDGKPEDFLSHCTEDVAWTMAGEGTQKGKKAIREWMSQMEGMEPPRFTVDKIIAENDSVVCFGDMTMKDDKGVEGKYSYCDAYRFDGDKVAELKSFVVKHKTEAERSGTAAA